jgi:hypothetical protein
MRIAVYCSARQNIPQAFLDDATAFGKWIGENGHTLVYGGLAYSMMRDVAQACADAGGKVIGLVPQSRIADQHPANTVNIHVETLHERKQMMEENADVFVALEGGIGTLDEVFSAISSTMFFHENKHLYLLDRDGLYQPLHTMIQNMEQLNLVTDPASTLIHFCPDVETLTAALQSIPE